MSPTTGTSALAHIINNKMIDIADIRNDHDIHDLQPADNKVTMDIDSAGVDTTLHAIMGMVIISTLTGNTSLTALAAFIIIVAVRITTLEDDTSTVDTSAITLIQQVAAPADAAIPAAHINSSQPIDIPADTTHINGPILGSHIDREHFESIALTEEEAHIYRHTRPTFDIVEISIPTTNPAITSGPKAKLLIPLAKEVNVAARFGPHIDFTAICKLSTIYEVDEEDIPSARPETKIVSTQTFKDDDINNSNEEDIEFPRSFGDEEDSSFNSAEDFSDTEEDTIAFVNKVHRLCDELEKVECFSDPVEHTIELAKDIEATFQKWDEEDLEAFSDSEENVVAIAMQIEVDTRPTPPTPPESPTRAASPAPAGKGSTKFTESGFLIESPDNLPIQEITRAASTRFTPSGFLVETPENAAIRHSPENFATLGPMIFTSSPAPETPTGPRAHKPIFASPVGEPFFHTRKVSNETNTSEDTNDTKDSNETNCTKTTATEPGSPATVYSSPDHTYEYQAMAGFIIALSSKTPTRIDFAPIAQSGENIHYDRRLLKEESPSPSPMSCGNTSSTSSYDPRDIETPYYYSDDTPEDLDILAILERPGGPKYAKLSCGNWYFYNDDGSVDHLNWEEYEELLAFIVGDVASLPQKLHQVAIQAAAKLQDEREHVAEKTVAEEGSIVEEPIANVGQAVNQEKELPLPWDDEEEEPATTTTETTEEQIEEQPPLPWVPWDDDEPRFQEKGAVQEIQDSNDITEDFTESIDDRLPLPRVPWDEALAIVQEEEESILEVQNTMDEEEESILERWYTADEMPPTWEVIEHIPCPAENSSFAEYVRGSDDHWYFRLAGPEYRPLDSRELRWFISWRHDARPINTIVELGEEDFF
ncbi:hypothetical protein QBC32DRAFT_265263 [Pseudoneurospora amorphoporcata]|uniref:Uncharacterized protein n=1 Tax=Pseudoneurospora amorphoporcata TaxID=241081 RepID=A0AAN6NQV3_9PEZI|nr:hypothetical protein QBC32DRAFT_265263 [Pseudoneurospora amorphoporcata]